MEMVIFNRWPYVTIFPAFLVACMTEVLLWQLCNKNHVFDGAVFAGGIMA